MDRNYSLFYSKQKENLTETNNNNKNYKLIIKLGKKIKREIIIKENSNPEELAYNFCLNNNLDYKYLKSITKKIRSIKNSNLFNTRNTFNSPPNQKSIDIGIKNKNIQLTEDNNFNIIKFETEKNIKNLESKEFSLNNISIKEYNNIENKENQNSFIYETKKKSNENNKNKQLSLSKKLSLSKDISNTRKKNLMIATNVINQEIQNCLALVEKEIKPFYNDSTSEIKKETKSSKLYEKSEFKLGSFIIDNENINNSNNSNSIINNNNSISINNANNLNNFNEENNDLSIISNNDKDKKSIKGFNEEYIGNLDNTNLEEDKLLIDKDSFIINNNNIISDNFFNNNDIQALEQDIDTNISKSVAENVNINIKEKNNIHNNKSEKINKIDKNNNLVISEEININIPSYINREININILSSPKIPFNNKYNYEERYKKRECKSNKLIPKFRNKIKNISISDRSDSIRNKDKNKISFDLFKDEDNKINNGLENRNKRLSGIYNNTKNKMSIYKENIQTPSTYVKSCKNSLSTLTLSEKNLLLSIKDNNMKNNILNKNNNGSTIDDFFNNRYSLSNLNSTNSLNKNLYNNYKMSQKRLNSISLNDNIISEENPNSDIKNNINKNSTMKEKSNKFMLKNSFEKNILNFNNVNKEFPKNFIKINDIRKCKKKRNKLKRNKLIDKENINYNYNNNTVSNTSLIKFKNIDVLLNNNPINEKAKIKFLDRKKNNTNILITDNNYYSKLLNQKMHFSPSNTIDYKTRKYIQFKNLTKNIISKKEIENYFRGIFNYISKNHEYLDVFKSMNTKTIPVEIYKPVQAVIKKCIKERFIFVNEFIQKGYEQFHFFSRNDKIAIMNFNIFS